MQKKKFPLWLFRLASQDGKWMDEFLCEFRQNVVKCNELLLEQEEKMSQVGEDIAIKRKDILHQSAVSEQNLSQLEEDFSKLAEQKDAISHQHEIDVKEVSENSF